MKKEKEVRDIRKLSLEEIDKIRLEAENKVRQIHNKGLTFCIVRTYSAGVFAGLYDRKTKGMEGTVFDARRLWYWKGAASLSQLANEGVKFPEECKFAQVVKELDLKEIIEVLPCTKEAIENISAVPVWSE